MWPLLRFTPIYADSDEAKLKLLSDYKWLVFSSANGARYFCERFAQFSLVRPSCFIAAVGTKTANVLRQFGWDVHLIPPKFIAESLAEQLPLQRGERLLIVRGNLSREIVQTYWRERDIEVEEWLMYTNEQVLHKERVPSTDWVLFFSPSAVDAYHQQTTSGQPLVASIGPVTTKKLVELGYNVTVEANPYTEDGLLAAIAAYEEEQRR